MKERTCCFLGHRKIENTLELSKKLYEAIENLIVYGNIDTFLFGSKSEFNTLCYELVTKLKEKYPHIKRIYVRAEYPYVNDNYKAYLVQNYEYSYYPKHLSYAGRAIYVKRNFEMIDNSQICVFYYKPDYTPYNSNRMNSGTKIAYNYAETKGKTIINLAEL